MERQAAKLTDIGILRIDSYVVIPIWSLVHVIKTQRVQHLMQNSTKVNHTAAV